MHLPFDFTSPSMHRSRRRPWPGTIRVPPAVQCHKLDRRVWSRHEVSMRERRRYPGNYRCRSPRGTSSCLPPTSGWADARPCRS